MRTYLWKCIHFALASLIGIHIWISSSGKGLEICVITAGIKKYKSTIKKKKKLDKMVLSAKPKFSSIEVLISNALRDSNNSRNEFVLINNIMKELYDWTKTWKIQMKNKS